MSAVTFRNVFVTFGKSRCKINALDCVDISVPDGGGIFGLLGPSGCGKTTFLLTALNLVKPDRGTVLIYGRKPGDAGLEIPGSNVGLYKHFEKTKNIVL